MGQTITVNRAARHEYFVLETYEAGIELYGTEIKSIRNGSVNLKESWADIQNGEVLGISKVQFIPGQSIKAISGPFKGYEGNVVHVNKKQQCITVRSLLTKDGKTFDLNYEEAEKVEVEQ